MKYRILAPGYINNPFRIVSTHYVDEKTGEERDLPFRGAEEVFSLQVDVGTIVELDGSTKPAPWMEPMDDEAHAMCEKYPDAYAPSALATIDSLAFIGQPLDDRASYVNEVGAGPSKAPVYAKPVQARLGDKAAPRLPTLGVAPRSPGGR